MNREDDRKYEADVFYEAWRRGVDPDRAVECASDCRIDGYSPEECVDGTAREIRREHERREAARSEEEYFMECERQRWEEMQAEQQKDKAMTTTPGYTVDALLQAIEDACARRYGHAQRDTGES